MTKFAIIATLAFLFSGVILAHESVPGFSPLAFAADVDGGDGAMPSWANGIGVITASVAGPVFGLWYAWYVTVVRLPKIEDEHRQRINGLIGDFRSDLRVFWTEKREDDRKLTEAINEFRDAVSAARCGYQATKSH